MNHEEEEDGEWVPLEPSNRERDGNDDMNMNMNIDGHGGVNRHRHKHSHARVEIPATTRRSTRTTSSSSDSGDSKRKSSSWGNWRHPYSSSSPSPPSQPSPSSSSAVLQQIRNRHETNSRVKKTFVHQPLSIFPRRFLYHLIREIWACHPFIRWGILFLMAGWMLQIASFTFLFYMSLRILPRLILNACMGGIALYLYFNPQSGGGGVDIVTMIQNLQRTMERNIPNNVQDALFSLLESIGADGNGQLLQHFIVGIIYILPAAMEVLALLLLTLVNEEMSIFHGYYCMIIILELGLLIPFHFDIFSEPHDATARANTNTNTNANEKRNEKQYYCRGRYRILDGHITFVKKAHSTLMDCRIHAWICLYAITLLTACFMMGTDQSKFQTPLLLGGPFLLATGFFLILSTPRRGGVAGGGEEVEDDEDNLIMDVLRRVIRQTLADVMMEVGEDVAQDEMLRLAMLRWIVDYWAASDSTPEDCDRSYSNRRHHRDSQTAHSRSESTHSRHANDHNTTATSSSPPVTSSRPNTSISEDVEPLGWSELSSMLSLTMAQMHSETNANTASSSDSYRPGPRESNNSVPPPSPSPSPSPNRRENESVHNLQSMMSSLNIDERAKPAVDSYKLAVDSIPPSRTVAITIALMRRCPALFSSIYIFLLHPRHGMQGIILLLPLILLEYMRVLEWLAACHETTALLQIREEKDHNDDIDIATDAGASSTAKDMYGNLLPLDMNSMQILLSEDSYSTYNRGTAMKVWNNIQSSIGALYSGLTAMKCAHTAQVATHVAFNVISLAQFAVEVRHEGLGYNVGLILMDIFEASSSSDDDDGDDHHGHGRRGGGPRRYRSNVSHAAINVMEGAKVLSRNVRELVGEGKDGKNFLSPVVSFFCNARNEESDHSEKESQDGPEDDILNESSGDDDAGERKENSGSMCKESKMTGMDDGHEDGLGVSEDISYSETDTTNNEKTGHDRVAASTLNDLELDDELSSLPSPDVHSLKSQVDLQHDDDESWTDIDAVPTENENMNDHSSEIVSTTCTAQTSSEDLQSTINAAVSLTLGKSKINEEENTNCSDRGTKNETTEANVGDDTLKWLGAGAAIIGTVIGGIALSGNNKEEPQKARPKSNVVIERIDE